MKFYDALTDFIFTEQKPEKADAIFVPGGLYGEIAQHAAELYQQGFASLIVPSGKYSIVEGKFTDLHPCGTAAFSPAHIALPSV